jgi:hypothetical protein
VGCHDLQVENVHPIVAVQVGTEVVTPLASQFLPTGCEDHQVKDIDRAVGIDVAGDVVSEALRRCRGSGLPPAIGSTCPMAIWLIWAWTKRWTENPDS